MYPLMLIGLIPPLQTEVLEIPNETPHYRRRHDSYLDAEAWNTGRYQMQEILTERYLWSMLFR